MENASGSCDRAFLQQIDSLLESNSQLQLETLLSLHFGNSYSRGLVTVLLRISASIFRSRLLLSRTMATEGKGVLLKADAIAETFRTEIKSALSNASRPPKLVGILATSASPSKFYADFTKKQCDALGVEFVLRTTGQAADESLAPGEGVEEAIIEANEDDTVDGIMVRPVMRSLGHKCLDTYSGIKVYYPIFGAQQVRIRSP